MEENKKRMVVILLVIIIVIVVASLGYYFVHEKASGISALEAKPFADEAIKNYSMNASLYRISSWDAYKNGLADSWSFMYVTHNDTASTEIWVTICSNDSILFDIYDYELIIDYYKPITNQGILNSTQIINYATNNEIFSQQMTSKIKSLAFHCHVNNENITSWMVYVRNENGISYCVMDATTGEIMEVYIDN